MQDLKLQNYYRKILEDKGIVNDILNKTPGVQEIRTKIDK
jgi:hypothetical protein